MYELVWTLEQTAVNLDKYWYDFDDLGTNWCDIKQFGCEVACKYFDVVLYLVLVKPSQFIYNQVSK